MKRQLIALAISAVIATQVASAALSPSEIHERVIEHLKFVRDHLVPPPVVQFVETFPPIAIPREKVLHLAQAKAEPFEAPAPPPDVPDSPVDPTGVANWAEDFAISTTQGVLDQIFPRGGAAPRRPIIVGGDAKDRAALAEDLTVMTRILEKAAGAKSDGPPTASGIALLSFGQPNSPRAFYLDGYGALFLLNVKVPLLAPPKPDDASHTNDATNTEWEKAKEEVYGRRKPLDDIHLKMAPGEEFNASRVENLKTQLIDDLANAKNIRNLKLDDSVTVVVLGGGSRGSVTRRVENRNPMGGRFGGGGGRPGGTVGGAYAATVEVSASNADVGAQSTMTLRAKKSDIDAFAKGKLTADEFQKKVAVQVY